jgi:hypothetical protein
MLYCCADLLDERFALFFCAYGIIVTTNLSRTCLQEVVFIDKLLLIVVTKVSDGNEDIIACFRREDMHGGNYSCNNFLM